MTPYFHSPLVPTFFSLLIFPVLRLLHRLLWTRKIRRFSGAARLVSYEHQVLIKVSKSCTVSGALCYSQFTISTFYCLLNNRGYDDSGKQEFSWNVPEQVISNAVFMATCNIRRISGNEQFSLQNSCLRGNKLGNDFSFFSSFHSKSLLLD